MTELRSAEQKLTPRQRWERDPRTLYAKADAKYRLALMALNDAKAALFGKRRKSK